jgi:hypothetical protein
MAAAAPSSPGGGRRLAPPGVSDWVALIAAAISRREASLAKLSLFCSGLTRHPQFADKDGACSVHSAGARAGTERRAAASPRRRLSPARTPTLP